ncbi:hypothetical protein LZ31DRAFT_124514 [Colletotrichum somersetense]|nr:hypothetical protein LZ31DRAFT_124514 [Colletotrichum somersetense]
MQTLVDVWCGATLKRAGKQTIKKTNMPPHCTAQHDTAKQSKAKQSKAKRSKTKRSEAKQAAHHGTSQKQYPAGAQCFPSVSKVKYPPFNQLDYIGLDSTARASKRCGCPETQAVPAASRQKYEYTHTHTHLGQPTSVLVLQGTRRLNEPVGGDRIGRYR